MLGHIGHVSLAGHGEFIPISLSGHDQDTSPCLMMPSLSRVSAPRWRPASDDAFPNRPPPLRNLVQKRWGNNTRVRGRQERSRGVRGSDGSDGAEPSGLSPGREPQMTPFRDVLLRDGNRHPAGEEGRAHDAVEGEERIMKISVWEIQGAVPGSAAGPRTKLQGTTGRVRSKG